MGQLMRLTGGDPGGDGAASPVSDHASLGPLPVTRAAKRLTLAPLSLRSPSSCSPGRLLVRAHAGAVEEHQAELHATLLHEAQKPLPDTGTSPADEDLS